MSIVIHNNALIGMTAGRTFGVEHLSFCEIDDHRGERLKLINGLISLVWMATDGIWVAKVIL
jgi:hypothetical protein